MAIKMWSLDEIRELARQTVDGKKAVTTARGAYFRALVESAQVELRGKGPVSQAEQVAAVKKVHRRFYPAVEEAVNYDIKKDRKNSKDERDRRTLERNRRTNFARTAYGAIKKWLRAPDHDLLKLDPQQVTKSQLLDEAPPSRQHTMTPKRIQARGGRLIDQLVRFAKQIAKGDEKQAAKIVEEAMQELVKFTTAHIQATTDVRVAAREGTPLRLGKKVFISTTDGLGRSRAA